LGGAIGQLPLILQKAILDLLIFDVKFVKAPKSEAAKPVEI
jgi:hypothetical protein